MYIVTRMTGKNIHALGHRIAHLSALSKHLLYREAIALTATAPVQFHPAALCCLSPNTLAIKGIKIPKYT